MNRAGDLVEDCTRISNILLDLDAGFLYSNATGALINLREEIISGPTTIHQAIAINDAGDIAANADPSFSSRAVLLVRRSPAALEPLVSVAASIVLLLAPCRLGRAVPITSSKPGAPEEATSSTRPWIADDVRDSGTTGTLLRSCPSTELVGHQSPLQRGHVVVP